MFRSHPRRSENRPPNAGEVFRRSRFVHYIRRMPPPEPTLPEDLAAAWDHVLREWGDPPRHAAFIELCALRGHLGDAGALYRRIQEDDPARAAVATEQLQRIMGRAMAMLAAQAPAAPVGVGARRMLMVVAVVVAAALMGSAVWAATQLVARGAAS